ncbi:hypothetical protein SAMN04490203_1032 [Pseudomonas taetrolens]|uniref:Transmembrane protein n=1 Tax=Pseudomonas taetrolens TaxID=47884 RepID=A0A0J6GWP3_PSETA|nr:DUF6708 domain-containing protein [Pseudomonas taetrolens]KMM86683.1 hypothetical protein TU78_01460 [Pseudomonas taetrolens]SEB72128.1 hypothetical protein SAMN04490203_1032 [Pseudomonas taetrolens]SQF85221.1 Uncharacterised protein [Pseudomonas taetrolens]VEH47961.1 Uncharacterised protein [Pseudomonas taetrolens]
MSRPEAGARKKRVFSQQDYLAPLPIPTGKTPVDMLNIIWRKNDVFLDVGNFNVGGAVMVIWFMSMFFLSFGFGFRDISPEGSTGMFLGGAVIVGIPTLVFIYNLIRPTPLPIRFNRQRREVCVPREDGEYWVVPWESVTAAASQHTAVSRAGPSTMGLLFISFDNPDPEADEDNKHFYWGFNCGGNEAAMALWECMRSYMEIGPHALPPGNDFETGGDSLKQRGIIWGICCEYAYSIWLHVKAEEIGKALWLVLGIFIFGGPLVFILQSWKLSPPPDLTYPDIIEWSKPLPPEQWAKRSPELESAIAQREAELAAGGLSHEPF